MPKSIRIDDSNYNRLAERLRPRESFNDVVGRLLNVNDKADELLNAIEGSIRMTERKIAELSSRSQ